MFTTKKAIDLTSKTDDGVVFKLSDVRESDGISDELQISKIFEQLEITDLIFIQPDIKYSLPLTTNAFISAIATAYKTHRPLELSPDIIWFLLLNGLSQHMSVNNIMVEGLSRINKTTLTFKTECLDYKEIGPIFRDLVKQHLNSDIARFTDVKFSTSKNHEQIAFSLAVMDVYKPFFEYEIMIICGIPRIKLTGTPADWIKLYKNAQFLKEYDLAWWIDSINPILKEFIDTSQGKIRKNFWEKIYYITTQKQTRVYGSGGRFVEGWCFKFLPYYNSYNRDDVMEIICREKLQPTLSRNRDINTKEEIISWSYDTHKQFIPHSITDTEVSLIIEGKSQKSTLHLHAGLFAIYQNKVEKFITPVLGWFVTKKQNSN